MRHVPLSAVVGHSDVRLTARYYVDLRVEDARRAVEGVSEIIATSTSVMGTARAR